MLPDWSRQAELEFSELARRKQDELRRERPPQLNLAPEGAAALTLAAAPPPIARPPKPGLPARSEGVGGVRAEPSSAWPPPGTILLAGRIGGVECSPEGKIVIVDAPLFRARLLMDDQVRLYYPPLKWRELPCGTRGWVVNAAYRPVPGLESVRGVLVALVF
jgi:hypothetical protein